MMTSWIIQLSLMICSVILASSANPSTGNDVTKPLIKCISLTPHAYKCEWNKEPNAIYTFEHRNLPKGNWKKLPEKDSKAYVVGTGNQKIRVNATNSIGSAASSIITYDVRLHLKPNITYRNSTMTDTSATLSWTTEDIYTGYFFKSQVAYEEYDGETNETGEMIELNRTRKTTFTIDGLKPDRSYRFYIRSRYDRAGNNFTEWTYGGKKNRACFQTMDNGNGNFTYRKWYYDAGDMICKPFNYSGGLSGNDNRFESHEECSSQCNSRCYQHIPSSHNSACDGSGFEWAYNPGRGECLPYRKSSCHSADYSYNRFKTKRVCERDCKRYGVDQPELPHCPRINTNESVCNSTFIVSGKVSSISLQIYSEYLVHRLVVEVSQAHKGRDSLPLYSVSNTDGSTTEFLHIKKIIVDDRSCHDIDTDTIYVFMGDIQNNNAVIDDDSYVKEESPSVLNEISMPTCSI